MGWREALEQAVAKSLHISLRLGVHLVDLNMPNLVGNLTAMPPPDRIALARELLEGTGKTVADAVVIGKPSIWPAACLHPNSCARHRDCMYLGCEHQGFSIADGVDAALAALKAQENTP